MASQACCDAGPAITSDYEPKGTISKLEDFDVYKVGSGPATVVIVYDIFGLSKQAKQVSKARPVAAALLQRSLQLIMFLPYCRISAYSALAAFTLNAKRSKLLHILMQSPTDRMPQVQRMWLTQNAVKISFCCRLLTRLLMQASQ
jgi:hypothetical protein